jgi:DNA-binding transcriptional LysR family regulator
MSIRRLKTLIAISETGSFVAAADRICITSAAVSQQMKTLESDYQVALFDRSKRSPELNQLGLALVSKAKELVHAYEHMMDSLVGEDGLMGELSIGAVPTTMAGLVPQGLSALREDYPQLRIRVVPGLSADLLPQVERGALDAAIVSEPQSNISHLNWRPFASEPLIVLASEEAESDDPEYLLEHYPYIRFTRRAWAGELIDNWLKQRKLKIQASMELDTLESIASMVYNNLGVSIVPDSCIPPLHPLPLKRIPLGPTAKPRVLGIISRHDSVKYRVTNAIADKFEHLVEAVGSGMEIKVKSVMSVD